MDGFSSDDITISETGIKGLLIFEKKIYPDERGWYQEVYRVDDIAKALGVDDLVVKQGSFTWNVPKALRGLHAEPQYKLITPLSGKIFAAIVDLRVDSKTFAKVETFLFDNEEVTNSRRTLVISPGLANSMEVVGLSGAFYHYAVSSTYDPVQIKRSIIWDDPDLNIDWPIKDPIISDKDKNNQRLRELFPEKFS
ncbi:dTDP-4-dehydrorhamnose 3,5-epimerase family protein [Candidatus Daviesbacteria bacterium]|nr:dTDP-4-dehydrorhamnose 3,5-epimerase family protein [Candidatus Daviesbacteria bacterium]